MLDTRIILSATWVVATLIYLYGDVLRIYHGGGMVKALAEMKLNQFVWLGIAVLMLTPILMVFLNLVLPQPVEPLGEHHRRSLLLPVQPGWSAHLSTVI